MPSFSAQIQNLVQAGPIVEILVGPSQQLRQVIASTGQSLPAPVRAVAMIDTGASGTVLSPSIIQALGIQPVGVIQMSTPSTQQPITAHQYDVSMSFPNGVTVAQTLATEAPLGGQHIQCLIGRDILQHGVLVYIGYLNQFTLSF